jgi:hypothetical protein
MVVRSEEDLAAEDDGTIGWIGGVPVPLTPPACTSITGGAIIRVSAVKINDKGAAGAAVGGGRVLVTAVQVDSD